MSRRAAIASIVAGSLLVAACSRKSQAPPPPAPPTPTAASPTKRPVQVPTFVAQPVDEDDYASFRLVDGAPPVTITMPRAATSTALLTKIGRVFLDVRRRLGATDETAAVARINAAAGAAAGAAAVPVDDDVRWLLSKALALGKETGGAFDVTAQVLVDGWRAVALGEMATRAMLDAKLPLVGAAGVVIHKESRAVSLRRKGMALALDVLAVGYAMDGAAELLVADGVTSFRIEAAGQVLVAGGKAGRQWRVKLGDDGPGGGFGAIDLWQGSVAALQLGQAATPVVDPRTGRQVRDVRAVFVLGPDATMARAQARTIAVLGKRDGLVAASAWTGIRVLVVDAAGKLHTTPGLADALLLGQPPRSGPP